MNWEITDQGSTIKVVHLGVEKYNSPKDDTQVMAFPAQTGENTSGVGKLYIGNDNSYQNQIPWNDVIVSGDAPTDLDDFESKVNVILNNITGSSPAPIDLTTVQAVDLIDHTSDGQLYRIKGTLANPLPEGITNILIYGAFIGTDGYDNNSARAFVTSLGAYFPCTYDVSTNKISCSYVLWAAFMSQIGGAAPIIDKQVINISGETPTLSYHSLGDYEVVFTSGQLIDDTSVIQYNNINYDGVHIYQICGAATTSNIFTLNVLKGDAPIDEGMFKTYIEIKINISNY